MNAVAAVFGAADAQAARTAVGSMLDRMPVRGAGHRVIVAAGGGVIGAAGPSPAFSTSEGVALLAGDLRLDNAADLRAALGLSPDAPAAVIVIEAFARWGVSFAAHLAGDFALVLLDRRERRLVAVRDPLGIRPLYYREGTTHVRAASELGALVEPGDAPDEGFLAEVLGGDIADTEGTPYLSVRRLPAGHVLVASDGQLRVRRYWEPPREQHSGSLAEHAERFRAVFDEAVRARCDGHAQVGVHLSGGLDSSSVLGSICANGYAVPLAASLRFPWPEADEGEWIGIAARRWSIEPLVVMPPVDPAAHDLASIASTADLPDVPTGGPLFRGLHEALRTAGASVVLTGLGGDQWWSGEMAHMADLLRRGRLGALRRWHAAGGTIGEEVTWSWHDFAHNGLVPLVPRFARRAARLIKAAPLPPWISREFAARVDLRGRLRRRPDTHGAPSESWRRMRWRLDSGEEAFAKEATDRAAVAAGIDLRHPFYDRRLVELAFALPEDARLGGERNRAAMRTAMAPRLAPETAARVTKADPSRLLVEALRAADVEPHLAVPSLARLGWVTPSEVARLVDRVRVGGQMEAGSPLWRVLGVEAWLAHVFGAR
ncbi:MAG TPA: asparagine synthase-related protein [Vicinamibacterales bacterium]|nr:asparagine synthase-related protein [Vicinamibacterales bacterium]